MEVNFKDYVLEFKKGDMSHFDVFYNSCKEKVFYNIFSLTKNYEVSEDILQDTFVKFLKGIKDVNENENILGFLMMMSRNLTLDHFKKNNRVLQLDETKDIPQHHDEHLIDKNIILEKVKDILKPKEFEIFTMHVLSELTFEEISKLKRRPLGTITRAYKNAIKKIKESMVI